VIKSKLSGDAYRFGRVRDKSGIAEIFIGGSRKFPNIVLPMELRRMRAKSQLRFHWLRSFDGCNYLVPHLSKRCHSGITKCATALDNLKRCTISRLRCLKLPKGDRTGPRSTVQSKNTPFRPIAGSTKPLIYFRSPTPKTARPTLLFSAEIPNIANSYL